MSIQLYECMDTKYIVDRVLPYALSEIHSDRLSLSSQRPMPPKCGALLVESSFSETTHTLRETMTLWPFTDLCIIVMRLHFFIRHRTNLTVCKDKKLDITDSLRPHYFLAL